VNNQKRHIELAIEALRVVLHEDLDIELFCHHSDDEILDAIKYLESILYIFVEDKEKAIQL
jgi:hypothetical protein